MIRCPWFPSLFLLYHWLTAVGVQKGRLDRLSSYCLEQPMLSVCVTKSPDPVGAPSWQQIVQRGCWGILRLSDWLPWASLGAVRYSRRFLLWAWAHSPSNCVGQQTTGVRRQRMIFRVVERIFERDLASRRLFRRRTSCLLELGEDDRHLDDGDGWGWWWMTWPCWQ